MKKSLYLTVVLLILTSIGVGAAAVSVSRQHHQIWRRATQGYWTV